MRSKSINRSGSVFLLTGLLTCGVCGAKMRYQKWGNSGYKIYCYSQQTSKRDLIKDASCDNYRYWADEVEQAVMNEIFNLSFTNSSTVAAQPLLQVADTLQKQYEKTAAELKNLYKLYAKQADPILIESIDELKVEVEKILKEIEREKEKKTVTKAIENARTLLKTLPQAWKHMTDKEKQTAVRQLIEKVVLFHGRLEVYFKLEEYLKK